MNYSTTQRAVMVMQDVTLLPKVKHEICYVVQQFNYSLIRDRDYEGINLGSHDGTIMHFQIRISPNKEVNNLYQYLSDGQPHQFSFLFNTTFDEMDYLENAEDGMVVEAIVVECLEEFISDKPADDHSQSLLFDINLLVRQITYIGKNGKDLTYTIIS